MTPEQLKASLLQYAMKGRITEQLESDGNATELLPLLNIDPQIKANDPPFDIPENWLWVPIGNLGESTGTDSFSDGPFGSNLKTVHYITEPEVRIIQLSNIGENGWKDKNVKYTSYKHLEEVIPRCEVHPGDFVIAKMMPAGRTIEVPDLGTRITLGSDAMKFVPNRKLDKKYLLWAMHSQAFLEQVYAEAHGITRVRTTLNGVKSYVLPIPPLEEQHRIVAKIEELLPYVDRYAEAYEKLEQFNAKFPEDMKKSILQYAIQGKLVEQRPEEGTAEELYQQIQDEKQKLIKEGKIKKERPLAEITEDEIPFDIPESWKWCYLQDIAVLNSGNQYEELSSGVPYIKVADMNLEENKEEIITSTRFVSPENKGSISTNSIIFPKRGGAIATNKKRLVRSTKIYIDSNTMAMTLLYEGLLPYIKNWFDGVDLGKLQTGSSVPQINNKDIYPLLVPLPPLEEQHRIVAKIEELLPFVDQLAKNDI